MQSERYPIDLIVSTNDFMNCGWKDLLEHTSREGYSSMWQELSAAARTTMEKGQKEHGKVLWLLADACSMKLAPTSPNEPFKPFARFHDGRSVIPDDLTDSDISFFIEIMDLVDNVWLKARVADLCWLRKKPKVLAHALAAIDAYRGIPLDTNTWIRGGQQCWERALSLARMLRTGAGDRVSQMEAAILATFDVAKHQDGFLGLWLAELLKEYGMGHYHRADISKRLESLAEEFDGEGDQLRARKYFSAASDWYTLLGDESKVTEMTLAVAEGWVKEAIARTSSNSPSHMAAASFYENAIQTYRTIPKTERATYLVDERIAELRTHLNVSGEKALEEMSLIRSPGINISQMVENARRSVIGKSAHEALFAFSSLHCCVNVKDLRNNVLEKMRQYPLQSLFASTVMSRDGRVIAKRPAMNLIGSPTEDDEIAIRSEMIRDYGISVHIAVQGYIWPALDVLLLEHRLREADFIDLARNSPIIPKDRAGLFGKALFAGYERDFVIALHLLIPQIEHLVRIHLKQAGANTTNLDKDGIQNENGMSTLMDLPEAEDIFGKDLSFELKSLFCDAFGPNLRNELAHGLLEEDDCHSSFAIYAWWLSLRLIFKTWWNARRKSEDDKAMEESNDNK
ncbi:hypothetical protein AI20_13930 [Aeromonas hydrophila YL17]|nr:hypothetical protein AI20_13930 [Aeromonas hydrophila YL17]